MHIYTGDLKKVCRKNNKTFRFWLFNDYLCYGMQYNILTLIYIYLCILQYAYTPSIICYTYTKTEIVRTHTHSVLHIYLF